MDLFSLLGSGIGESLSKGFKRGVPFTAEDDAIVETNRGRMPLNMVEGDIQWKPIRRNKRPGVADFGPEDLIGSRFSPFYRTEIPSQTLGIDGATNPTAQMRRGLTPYSLGEGPRTNFNRYR